MDPLSLAVAGATLVKENAVVKGALQEAEKHIRKNSSNIAQQILDKMIVSTQLGFHDFLLSSYRRCRFFKTVLPPNQPVEVLSHYVNVDLEAGAVVVPDAELIESLDGPGSVIITGLAGSGKSMLMKYLTVRHFEYPNGSIPLFVELRTLNDAENRVLIPFIKESCTTAENKVSDRQFDMALSAGAFTLLLDGFDELHDEYKDNVQKQIIALRHKYPKVAIVISSRPSDRFRNWLDFSVYKVKELTKEQCLNLIDIFEYDENVKSRFRHQVDTTLYSSHGSFLQYPLLTTIMLLTYEEFAQVPTRMHEFYRQAFDTLYQKHDASKDQYTRKTKVNLERDDFRLCFSSFCAFSYADQTFSFSGEKLKEYAANSIRYLKSARTDLQDVSADGFIADLFDAVCMIQQDGTETAFVHRSFQEYFAALFSIRLPEDKMVKVLDRYARRYTDSAISMAYAMAPEKVESEWVLPTLNRILQHYANPLINWTARLARAIDGRFSIMEADGLVSLTSYGVDVDFNPALDSIIELYPELFDAAGPIAFGNRIETEELLKRLKRKSVRSKNEQLFVDFVNKKAREDNDRLDLQNITEEDVDLLDGLKFKADFQRFLDGAQRVQKVVEARSNKRSNLIDELL